MNDNTGCFRQSSVAQKYIPTFRDYDVRIVSDDISYGIYISSEFSNPNDTDGKYKGMSYHEEEGLISIELGTHDESLIAEAVSLCKDITEKFCMLDDLLNTF